MKQLMLGNEAVARGLYEGGCSFVSSYPGTPSTEITAAIIELKENETCTEEAINAFCVALPRYKRPRKIFFDKVPRNPTGKIEKPVLREKYCQGRLVEVQITG